MKLLSPATDAPVLTTSKAGSYFVKKDANEKGREGNTLFPHQKKKKRQPTRQVLLSVACMRIPQRIQNCGINQTVNPLLAPSSYHPHQTKVAVRRKRQMQYQWPMQQPNIKISQ
mmetsp:Transcript_51690/g.88996  ORF Transcript_51690/g.88996 Transcript_51690/m.88996 type:complete len:114 (+) Transcript_51690:45-386(+)